MGDFASVASMGAHVLPVRVSADPQAAIALAPVASSSSGRGAQARMDTSPQVSTRPAMRDRGEDDSKPIFKDRTQIDDFTLVGPTPAFQANVLELERDLQRAIDRLEAERGRVEAETAMKIEKAEARADAAEADSAQATKTGEKAAPEIPKAEAPKAEEKMETTAPAEPAAAPEAEAPDIAPANEEG